MQDKSNWGPAREGDINAPGDDLFSRGPYFVTDESPAINVLFAALFDLPICRTAKMGLLIPFDVYGSTLDAIFAEKVPEIKHDEREKWLLLAPRS